MGKEKCLDLLAPKSHHAPAVRPRLVGSANKQSCSPGSSHSGSSASMDLASSHSPASGCLIYLKINLLIGSLISRERGIRAMFCSKD